MILEQLWASGRQRTGARGKEQAGAVEGFPSFLYWGRGCIIDSDFCAGPSLQTGLHTSVYTHTSTRPELWWAGELKLFYKRVSERDLFQRRGGA